MLDPLSALSLASSITQFADFVIHLVEVFHNINRSGGNLTDTNRAYSAYATDLANNVSRIRRALLPLDGIPGSNTRQQHKLARLADDCMRAADEMNRTLNQLKKLRNENSWDKFIVAVKQEWNKNRLESMREKLSLVKQNAESEILLNVRTASANFWSLGRFHQQHLQRLEEIINTVQLLAWAFTSANWDVSKRYNVSDSLPRIEESIRADVQAKERFKARVKATLVFPSMPKRLEEIPEAHQRTFQWVYDPPSAAVRWDNFVDWLLHNSGIYWLRGKPGSGKSCLMKYLYDNPRNEALLKIWSQGVPVVKAGFFFWNAGTEMQKSQSGLLRSILFQILDQHPSLIPIAYPRQWDSYQTKFAVHDVSIDQPISLGGTELPNAMVRIVTQTSYPLRLCLFIDSLDEFDGDHEEIVELFKVIASVPTTKVIVSSRPWPIFTNAFAPYPGLVLHDLTRRDIQEYVSERLGESAGIKKLQSSEPEEAQLIINEVVEKSACVFLWVRIVVTSLLTGLTNDDRIADLQQRLRALPDEFFFDVALLRQPHSPLRRRIVTGSDAPLLSSWSWAGWQGELDLSAWSDSHLVYDESLRVRNNRIVDWQKLCYVKTSESGQVQVKEEWKPIQFTFHLPRGRFEASSTANLPWAWHAHQPAFESEEETNQAAHTRYFTYEPPDRPNHMQDIKFRFPFPPFERFRNADYDTDCSHLLKGNVQTATFMLDTRSAVNAAATSKRDNVRVVQDTYLLSNSSARVGCLRLNLYDEEWPSHGEPCELMAISEGVVDANHVYQPETSTPNSHPLSELSDLVNNTGTEIKETRFVYVLWIEWNAGIAYRRALGMIGKTFWEMECTGEIEIVLG